MKSISLVLFIFFACNLFSQTQAVKLVNSTLDKEIIIKENKRIRIKTINGKRISGRLKIIDNQTIMLKGQQYALADILKLKRNTLLVSILFNTVIFYIGTAFVASGIVITAYTSNVLGVVLGAIIGGPIIYGGIKSPNILKGFKISKDWQYQVINLPN